MIVGSKSKENGRCWPTILKSLGILNGKMLGSGKMLSDLVSKMLGFTRGSGRVEYVKKLTLLRKYSVAKFIFIKALLATSIGGILKVSLVHLLTFE